jgi:hypothetical protein
MKTSASEHKFPVVRVFEINLELPAKEVRRKRGADQRSGQTAISVEHLSGAYCH